MVDARTAIVVGGGIAGAATAIALQKAGIEAVVYEAHRDSAAGIGVFLTLGSNGIDALRTLDAGHVALGIGFPTPGIALRNSAGALLGHSSTGLALADGTVSRTLRRADLYLRLNREAAARGIRIEYGKRLVRADQTDAGVRARFADGTEVLFTAAWTVLGFLSPGYTLFGHTYTHYSPISQPISGLGIGATAPWMNTAFILSGALLIIGVLAVFHDIPDRPSPKRTWSIILLVTTGVGIIIDGTFTLRFAVPHMLGFLLAVGLPVISFPLAGSYLRGHPQWRTIGTWLWCASPLTLLLVVIFFASFTPTADGAEHGIAGLAERVLAVEGLLWFAVLGTHARLLNTPRP